MYQGKPLTLFRKYALPQMLGLLLNSVYLIVDGVFIGNRLGREAMAAAAVSVPVIEVLIAISIAVSSGAGVLISRCLGRGEREEANRIFSASIWLLVGISFFFVLLGHLFLSPLATLLGATPDIHLQACQYLSYILTFSPFLMFSFLLSGLVRNDNRPTLAMIALTLGSLSNILLDYVFMYPLHMGIEGAALATALGPMLTVLIVFPHFLRRRGQLHFERVRCLRRAVGRILSLGFPAFIMEFTIGIVTFVYNIAIVKQGYGEMGLAVYLIIGYLALIILTVFLGLAQGLQPLFSYYEGTGEVTRSRALLRCSIRIVCAVGIGCYALVLWLAPYFYFLFSPEDPVMIAFAYRLSFPYFWGFVFAGFNIFMITYWQALRNKRSALMVSLLRSVIVLPILVFGLPTLLGADSLWWCHSLAEMITAGIAILLFVRAGIFCKKNQPALQPAKVG